MEEFIYPILFMSGTVFGVCLTTFWFYGDSVEQLHLGAMDEEFDEIIEMIDRHIGDDDKELKFDTPPKSMSRAAKSKTVDIRTDAERRKDILDKIFGTDEDWNTTFNGLKERLMPKGEVEQILTDTLNDFVCSPKTHGCCGPVPTDVRTDVRTEQNSAAETGSDTQSGTQPVAQNDTQTDKPFNEKLKSTISSLKKNLKTNTFMSAVGMSEKDVDTMVDQVENFTKMLNQNFGPRDLKKTTQPEATKNLFRGKLRNLTPEEEKEMTESINKTEFGRWVNEKSGRAKKIDGLDEALSNTGPD